MKTKENEPDQIEEIKNNLNISINTEINLRETRAIAAIPSKTQSRKKQLNDQSWNWTSPG